MDRPLGTLTTMARFLGEASQSRVMGREGPECDGHGRPRNSRLQEQVRRLVLGRLRPGLAAPQCVEKAQLGTPAPSSVI
jgi:hypothetical protein